MPPAAARYLYKVKTKEVSVPISNSKEKFEHELADVYDAEHQFLEALNEMREAASDEKLKAMLEEHATQTEEQIVRLEQVFSEMKMSPKRQPCSGARGLVEEGSKSMEEAQTPELRDAVIITAATKAEHYEMVAYKDLIDGATLLSMRSAARLLTRNREEEVKAARKLERAAPRIEKAAA
jgi:ferritin-like metal-binding protein YciE